VKLAITTKQHLLLVFTALALAYAGHGLATNWAGWKLVDFVVQWFVSVLFLGLFLIVAAPAVSQFQEFFVGRKREDAYGDEVCYLMLMTLLTGALAVAFVGMSDRYFGHIG
jgi:hypothetical protein